MYANKTNIQCHMRLQSHGQTLNHTMTTIESVCRFYMILHEQSKIRSQLKCKISQSLRSFKQCVVWSVNNIVTLMGLCICCCRSVGEGMCPSDHHIATTKLMIMIVTPALENYP